MRRRPGVKIPPEPFLIHYNNLYNKKYTNNNMSKRIFSIIITILLVIEIFHFSSLPGTSTGRGIPFISIAYHFIIFFLLAFFLFQSIKTKNKIKASQIITTLLISILYAISDEIHQFFVPLRSCTFFDILIDLAGICLAILIGIYLQKQPKHSQQSLYSLPLDKEKEEKYY